MRRAPEKAAQAIVDAVVSGDLGQLRALLDAGGDPNARDHEHSETALGFAAGLKRREALALELLRHGADPDLGDERGTTPLMRAAASGSQGIAEQLLTAGANANAADSCGATALMRAASAADLDIARLLLAHGADGRSADKQGQTAAILAAEIGRPDIAAEVLTYRAHRMERE